jgi:hypothetical protein
MRPFQIVRVKVSALDPLVLSVGRDGQERPYLILRSQTRVIAQHRKGQPKVMLNGDAG